MADTARNSKSGAAAQQTSRLQKRRPSTLQIIPASTWNAAIPLLSPLAGSPTAVDRAAEMKSRDEPKQPAQHQRNKSLEAGKPLVFKKWQHPAAPFCYETSSFAPSFSVPVSTGKVCTVRFGNGANM